MRDLRQHDYDFQFPRGLTVYEPHGERNQDVGPFNSLED